MAPSGDEGKQAKPLLVGERASPVVGEPDVNLGIPDLRECRPAPNNELVAKLLREVWTRQARPLPSKKFMRLYGAKLRGERSRQEPGRETREDTRVPRWRGCHAFGRSGR